MKSLILVVAILSSALLSACDSLDPGFDKHEVAEITNIADNVATQHDEDEEARIQALEDRVTELDKR